MNTDVPPPTFPEVGNIRGNIKFDINQLALIEQLKT